MPGLLIIGYGNRLRSDDGAGCRVAELLRERFPPGEVEILALPQLTPELMEPISRTARVIFIDAAASGEPGEIRRREIVPSAAPEAFTHLATPEGLLAGAKLLYGAKVSAAQYTIAGLSFEIGEELTAVVEEAAVEVAACILNE